jgi:hypothetical protein
MTANAGQHRYFLGYCMPIADPCDRTHVVPGGTPRRAIRDERTEAAEVSYNSLF